MKKIITNIEMWEPTNNLRWKKVNIQLQSHVPHLNCGNNYYFVLEQLWIESQSGNQEWRQLPVQS